MRLEQPVPKATLGLNDGLLLGATLSILGNIGLQTLGLFKVRLLHVVVAAVVLDLQRVGHRDFSFDGVLARLCLHHLQTK